MTESRSIQWNHEVNLFAARLSVSQTQGLIAVPQDNRHIHLYDINGVRYGRPTKMSKVTHNKDSFYPRQFWCFVVFGLV